MLAKAMAYVRITGAVLMFAAIRWNFKLEWHFHPVLFFVGLSIFGGTFLFSEDDPVTRWVRMASLALVLIALTSDVRSGHEWNPNVFLVGLMLFFVSFFSGSENDEP
jgi:uncharacterized membrane protein YgdD (TMEM256/DUF423 family)